MSWKATSWAKQTRGHTGLASKVLLLVLSDYYNDEKGYAWSTQKRLADDCEMSVRAVKYVLDWLERAGFITTIQKGNQYQQTRYSFNFAVLVACPGVVLSQSYAGANNGGATIAPASEGANLDIVQVQTSTSEGANLVGTNPQEPIREPPVYMEIDRDREGGGAGGGDSFAEHNDTEVWPDWYATMWAIPGFKVSLVHARAWLTKNNISDDRAEITAYSVKSKWPGSVKNPYTDPWATFQHWVKRPPLAGVYRVSGRPSGNPTEEERVAEFERDAKELQRRRDAAATQ